MISTCISKVKQWDPSFAIIGKITPKDTLDANQAGTQNVPNIGSLEKEVNNTTNDKLPSKKTQSSTIKTSGFEIVTGVILSSRRIPVQKKLTKSQ